MLISECVKRFLINNTHPDLAALYNAGMELQILIAKDEGHKIEVEFKGRYGDTFNDGLETYYPIRIPKKANTEPENNNRIMPYNLDKHALAIGMSGWDFVNQKSIWVGYDFDSIIGHSDKHAKKLTDIQLKDIHAALENIPYVTVRRSTGGNGLHLYIFIDNIRTVNHTEHAALARYILGKMSAETGYDFQQKVDAFGTILWTWHRKIKESPGGLVLLKQGGKLTDIPEDWRQHIPVISGRRRKAIPTFINPSLDNSSEDENKFLEITGQRIRIPFDSGHQKLIEWLSTNGYYCSYNQDLHLVVTHTYALKMAHQELRLKGVFETIAEGKEKGDLNIFIYPLKNSSWAVKRFTKGVAEASTWVQDRNGYTSCYYNRDPDLKTVSITNKGSEMKSGAFQFLNAKDAQDAALKLGVDLGLPGWTKSKQCLIKRHVDGRLYVQIEYDSEKDLVNGGLRDQGWHIDKKYWCKLFDSNIDDANEIEYGNFDTELRHLLSPLNDNAGWAYSNNGKDWQTEPIGHITKVLQSEGRKYSEVNSILGDCIKKAWKLVILPFQPEYPGNRQWNKKAPQLRYVPLQNTENLYYPTWIKFLTHLGSSLDPALKNNEWAKENNILTGFDYLKLWIASVFQFPEEPLPYLFFYGEKQNTGKSSFHLSMKLLMTNGVVEANQAILSTSNFNGELENAIICAIEEINFSKDKAAFNKIKNWANSPIITIHPKGIQAYETMNYTKWTHTSNDFNAAPLFVGDSRITAIHVEAIPPEEYIDRKTFFSKLEKEAQHFLTEVMNLDIPPCNDRINIPIIETNEKLRIQQSNLSPLEMHISEYYDYIEGEKTKFSEFVDFFHECLEPNDVQLWSGIRIGRELPLKFPKGRLASEMNQMYIGNIIRKDKKQETNGHKKARFDIKGTALIRVEE